VGCAPPLRSEWRKDQEGANDELVQKEAHADASRQSLGITHCYEAARAMNRHDSLSVVAMCLAMVATFPDPARAQTSPHDTVSCTQTMAMKALDEADRLGSWAQVYASYRRYKHCDDGAIAEGYSSSVASLLADKWTSLGELEKIVKSDPRFGVFVLFHVDVTMSIDQAGVIRSHAATQCPKASKALCAKLRERLAFDGSAIL
jgi:hypothetical protein